MTERKSFKRHVRERMSKTGESYTAARAKVTEKRDRTEAPKKRLGSDQDHPADAKLDGTTRVNVWFVGKSPSKSQVALAHERLPDADLAETIKAMWRERLVALKSMLEE
jgi:hypothetical protein